MTGSCVMDSPAGRLLIRETEGCITQVSFTGLPCTPPSTPLCALCVQELEEYFAGRRRTFDLPLRQEGSPFRQQVWQALTEIPWGKTCSYGDIARRIGNPKATRAVGGANHHNQIVILVPCHRVIGADGSLGGYGGGTDKKRILLALEGRKVFRGDK